MSNLMETRRSAHVLVVAWVFVVVFFLLDLLIPPDIASGTAYVIVVFILARYGRYDQLPLIACTTMALVVVDTFISGPQFVDWPILSNRIMTLMAIGISAALLLQQQQLREQDKTRDILFRNLLDSAPDAMVIVNERGHIELANKQVEALFGYKKSDLIGRPIEVLMPERFAQAHVGSRNGYFASPVTRSMGQNIDLRALKQNGQEFPVEISLSPLETDQGLLVSAAIRDVSERREADAKFRNLLDSAPDAMVIVGDNGEIVLANKQTESVFGYSQDELVGQPIEILMPKRFQGKHAHHRQSFFVTPIVREMGRNLELFGQKKTGQEFPVEISLSPLETKEGLLVSAAIRDITERKDKEVELNRYAQQLESKNQELEQFAYIASHDLQEPMRTVSSFAGLLLDEYRGQLDQNADTYLQYISDSSQRMTLLIKGLLDYSRIGSQSTLSLVKCDDLLSELRQDLEVIIAEQHATVRHSGLPELVTYGNELRQLLQNLLSNAIKFHKPGCPPEVTVSATKHEAFWQFTVQDNGIGIDPLYQDRVFMIFHRLHTTDEYEGTGIGLAHCKKIVELLGGTLWLDSEPGVGSQFHFTVPDRSAEYRPPVTPLETVT
ncbi:PAS domain S-box protein [Litorivivens sp.]|uniref:sensor histidine kinase n=1 Tax=Litorivivens sp. TaxID=2020868 RepID=UPI0035669DA6